MAVLDNYPDDPAEAGASVLNSALMEQELLGAATSDAGFPTNPGPNTSNLDVDALGNEVIALGDIEIPVDQFMDFGQLGALASTSEASSPLDGHAASGLLGPDGGVTLDGEEADWGTTWIDLLSLADATGTSPFTDAVVDRLDLELGAMGSEVIAENGEFLDPDGGVTGPGQYIAGDASLYLHSPLIEEAAAQIYDLGGQVDTTVEELANGAFDATALAGLVPGVPAPDCTFDSNMQENIVNAVVGEPLTSANQLVTLDLSTGEMQIHLEHLVEGGTDPWGGGDDAGLNGLAPNTELISEGSYPQIAETVHELMEEAAQIMATAVEESLESVTVECSWFQEGPLPGDVIDMSWGPFTLAEAAAGNFPPVETNCAGPTAPALCETFATAVATSAGVLGPVFGQVYDFLIADEAAQVYDVLINDIKTGLITQTVGSAVEPVFDAIQQFVSLQVNHQETTTCVADDGTEAPDSLEVSALWLGFAQGDMGSIGLGNSGVRVDACNAAAPLGSIGDVVWEDTSLEGVQDLGEDPVEGVTVNLYDATGTQVDTTVTGPGGYTFADLPLGDYTVEFVAPEGRTFTIQDAGGDEATDSDADPTGMTDTITLTADAPQNTAVDAGLVPADGAIDPTISVDPTEVAPGECTVVTGEGYTPNSTATVQLTDAEGNPVGDPITVDTDENGAFTTDLCVPEDAEPGEHTVIGTDDTTGTPAETPLTVTTPGEISPTIVADPAEVFPGDETTITGEGYTPDSTATVQLVDAEGNPVGDEVTVTTDENGSFELPAVIQEDTPPGEYTVIGTDDTTGIPAEAPLTVLDGVGSPEPPAITADPASVPEGGAQTTVTGEGFTPEGMVTMYLQGADGTIYGEPEPFPAEADGTFVMPLNVAADAPADEDYTIVAVDEETGQEATTPFAITPDDGGGDQCTGDPSLVTTTDVVMPGEEVTVTGSGFPAGVEVAVQLTDPDGEPVGEPVMVTPDESCGFEITITVPQDADPGLWEVIATPEDGSDGASAPIAVCGPDGAPRALDAWFEFATVEAGAQQTFYASGFEPGEMVSAVIHSSPVSFEAKAADEDGVVSWTFTVPADFHTGHHMGVATSTVHGDHAIASFMVEAAGDGSGDGDGDGGDGGSAGGTGGDDLAATGSDAATLTGISFLLLAAGAALIRRRQLLIRSRG